jgi:hypothetical protein
MDTQGAHPPVAELTLPLPGAEHPSTLSAGKRLAEYELLRETGRGGMSTVYQARDLRLGRTVAVKVLAAPPALSSAQQSALIARLKREARAIAHLSHPNIVAIHDVGEQEGHHFIVMEFLQGTTLRDRLARGALSVAEAADILDQVAEALDAVHAQGVVHRDIKPSNVMILPDGRVKLLDFGVARHCDDATITQVGSIVGSPAYMSPEQVRGEEATVGSDMWALGVLLYEMLAGRPPYVGATIPSVLYQVTQENPAPPPGIPLPVQSVVRRALEKNPARRYRSARELASDFRSRSTAPFTLPPARRGKQAALVMALLLTAGLLLRWPLPGREAARGRSVLWGGAPSAPANREVIPAVLSVLPAKSPAQALRATRPRKTQAVPRKAAHRKRAHAAQGSRRHGSPARRHTRSVRRSRIRRFHRTGFFYRAEHVRPETRPDLQRFIWNNSRF